ncbi:MAG: Eco29kI family restriction endonuclease [Planctomycetota bacterium]
MSNEQEFGPQESSVIEREFDPLSYSGLGDAIASAFIRQPRQPLESFVGGASSGVYALYYHGEHDAYARLRQNWFSESEILKVPIYVGMGITRSNKGVEPVSSNRLRSRITGYRGKIEKVDLHSRDFHVVFLTMRDAWAVLAETYLISNFRPVWNVAVQGIGGNAPGRNRGSAFSDWDALHPGRQTQGPRVAEALERRPAILKRVREMLDEFFVGRYSSLTDDLRPGFVGRHER